VPDRVVVVAFSFSSAAGAGLARARTEAAMAAEAIRPKMVPRFIWGLYLVLMGVMAE